jgi:lipid A 3-O-deacylase
MDTKRLLTSLLPAMAIMSPAQAGELGVVAGRYDGHERVAVGYQGAPLWQGRLGAHAADIGVEYALGSVRAPSGKRHGDLWQIGATPYLRWWFAGNTGLEYGLGANLFSGTRLGDKEISTAFQFGNTLGVFHRLRDTPWIVGLRLTHYSNADIKQPNPGQDYLQLRASYEFR